MYAAGNSRELNAVPIVYTNMADSALPSSTPLAQLPTTDEDPTVQEVLQELNAPELNAAPLEEEEFYVAPAPSGATPTLLGALWAFVGDAKLIGIVAVCYIITEFTPVGWFITKYFAAIEHVPHSALIIKALFTAVLSFLMHRVLIAPSSP